MASRSLAAVVASCTFPNRHSYHTRTARNIPEVHMLRSHIYQGVN